MARINASAFYAVGSIGFGRHPQNPKLWVCVDTNDKNKFADATVLAGPFTDGKTARSWCDENKGKHAGTASVKIVVGQKLSAVQEVEELLATELETETKNDEIDPEVE